MADLTTPHTRRSATPVPTRGALAGADSDMSDTADSSVSADISLLPLAPKNPLPYRQQLSCLRAFHTGMETLRDAGGSVTRLGLAPKWQMPPIVVATSLRGGHDILGHPQNPISPSPRHSPLSPPHRSGPGSTPTQADQRTTRPDLR
jgi:hypothetical protein